MMDAPVRNEDGYKDIEGREARFSEWRNEFELFANRQHPLWKRYYAFVHNHQWSAEEERLMNGETDDGESTPARPMVSFNRIAALVRAVYGAIVHNPMGVTYVRRVTAPSDTSQGIAKDELLSSAAMYFRSQPVWMAEDQDHDSALDMLTCGMGCQQLIVETEITGEPELIGRRIDPFYVGWDTRSKEEGLRNRRWHFYKGRLSQEEMEEEFDFEPEQDRGGPAARASDPDHPGVESNDGYEVYHWQWFEREEFYRVAVPDPQTGQMKPEDKTKKELSKLQEGFDYIHTDNLKRRRRRYWEAFTHADKVLVIRKISVNAFTYEFLTGIRDDIDGMWYGIVRDAIDPQRWANKFLSSFIEVIGTAPKGLMVEDGVLDESKDAERDLANPYSITRVSAGAISGTRFAEKPKVSMPPSADKILDFSTAAIRETTGIGMEIIGQQMNDQAGVVEESRKAAAMAVVAWAFTSLRSYYLRHGHLLLRMMIEHIPRGRLVKMTDPSGQQQFVPFSYDDATYEVEVDDVPTSPARKAETHRALTAYAPMIQDPSVPPAFKQQFMLEYLRSSPLPGDAVRRLEEAMNKQPTPEELQQQQMALQNAQVDLMLKQAQAQLAMAMAKEKEMLVMVGVPKAQAEIEKTGTASLLDMAKVQDLAGSVEMKRAESEIDIMDDIIRNKMRTDGAEHMAAIKAAAEEHRAMTQMAMSEHQLDAQRRRTEIQLQQQRESGNGRDD